MFGLPCRVYKRSQTNLIFSNELTGHFYTNLWRNLEISRFALQLPNTPFWPTVPNQVAKPAKIPKQKTPCTVRDWKFDLVSSSNYQQMSGSCCELVYKISWYTWGIGEGSKLPIKLVFYHLTNRPIPTKPETMLIQLNLVEQFFALNLSIKVNLGVSNYNWICETILS